MFIGRTGVLLFQRGEFGADIFDQDLLPCPRNAVVIADVTVVLAKAKSR